MSRDERKALGMNLPIACHDIINLPMDEFNDMLSKHEMTEEQLTLCRDIRRRGKNKVGTSAAGGIVILEMKIGLFFRSRPATVASGR